MVQHRSFMRGVRALGGAAVLAATAFGFAATASATPTFDTFGPLPQATFGGSGIPNDAVAQSTFEGTGILALSSTQRFFNPPVTNDGAGNYFAEPGSNFGGPGSTVPTKAPSGISTSSSLRRMGRAWRTSSSP